MKTRLGLTKRQIARRWIAHHAKTYKETENPVFVWEAIAECLSHGIPLPAWVQAYLLTTAAGITRLSRDRVPKANSISVAVAKALGLQGRPRFNPFLQLARPGHDLVIAFDVYTHQTQHRQMKWSGIFHDVAEAHSKAQCDVCARGRISAKSVERIWRTHGRDIIPPHLTARSKTQKLNEILR